MNEQTTLAAATCLERPESEAVPFRWETDEIRKRVRVSNGRPQLGQLQVAWNARRRIWSLRDSVSRKIVGYASELVGYDATFILDHHNVDRPHRCHQIHWLQLRATAGATRCDELRPASWLEVRFDGDVALVANDYSSADIQSAYVDYGDGEPIGAGAVQFTQDGEIWALAGGSK